MVQIILYFFSRTSNDTIVYSVSKDISSYHDIDKWQTTNSQSFSYVNLHDALNSVLRNLSNANYPEKVIVFLTSHSSFYDNESVSFIPGSSTQLPAFNNMSETSNSSILDHNELERNRKHEKSRTSWLFMINNHDNYLIPQSNLTTKQEDITVKQLIQFLGNNSKSQLQ